MLNFKSYLGSLTLSFCMMVLAGCSTTAMVKSDLTALGMPDKIFSGDSTVVAKFMEPADVSKYCSKVINNKKVLPNWYHACVYKTEKGVIVMVAPKPGSMDAETYAELLEHEYQHVGQAMRGDELNHKDWN